MHNALQYFTTCTSSILCSAAFAVIVGMIFSRYTGRDPSWIIIAMSFVPDLSYIYYTFYMNFPVIPHVYISHSSMHSILSLVLISLLIAGVLIPFGIRLFDSLLCSALGIAAHFVEDALVYDNAYAFFWPITQQEYGIGILQITYKDLNVFGIANSAVLGVGIVLLIGALLIRTHIEGIQWWRVFLQGGRGGQQSLVKVRE